MSTATIESPVQTAPAAPVTTDTLPVKSEGCDSCGVSHSVGLNGEAKYVTQALVRVTLPGNVDGRPLKLTFCGSHAKRALKSPKMPSGIHVEDVTDTINTAPSVSANV